MNGLLDTHILLWWLADDRRLSTEARELLKGPGNVLHVSVVNLWEVAIKSGKGRLRVDFKALLGAVETGGFRLLPIQAAHVEALTTLPAHHADPFDRMLVAQAIAEKYRLITADSGLSKYGDSILPV